MWFCLFMAILCSLIYINLVITEIANGSKNLLLMGNNEDLLKKAQNMAFFKIILIVLMSIFWTLVICV